MPEMPENLDVNQWVRDAAVQLVGDDRTLGLVAQVVIVLVAVFLINAVLRRTLARLAQRADASASPWDDALVGAMRRPLPLLVWVVGLSFALEIIHSAVTLTLFDAIDPLRVLGIVAALCWYLLRFIDGVAAGIEQQRSARGESVDKATLMAVAKLLRVAVMLVGALVALQSLGFSVSGVLAFGGIGGIAIGFAAKDLLSNFFGGLMIYLDRPFTVGDWIRSPDKKIEGIVERIGWRLTVIRTFDKRPLYVPNSVFAQIVVENPSRMTNRQLFENIGVRYDDIDQVPAIAAAIRAHLGSHEEIDQQQVILVNLNQFNASSVDIMVYALTRTTDWIKFHQIKEGLLLEFARIIAAHGAQIAFPTRTVTVQTSAPQSAGMAAPIATAAAAGGGA